MKHTFYLVAIIITLFMSCKKEPGIGGDAEITGQVWTFALNGSLTDTIAEYAAEDTYVYIVFGNNTGFDKRVKTDYDGMYRFSYLYPGEYTLFVYSFDPAQVDGQSPVVQKITLEDRKQQLQLERFEILAQP